MALVSVGSRRPRIGSRCFRVRWRYVRSRLRGIRCGWTRGGGRGGGDIVVLSRKQQFPWSTVGSVPYQDKVVAGAGEQVGQDVEWIAGAVHAKDASVLSKPVDGHATDVGHIPQNLGQVGIVRLDRKFAIFQAHNRGSCSCIWKRGPCRGLLSASLCSGHSRTRRRSTSPGRGCSSLGHADTRAGRRDARGLHCLATGGCEAKYPDHAVAANPRAVS